jgi:drug/metabolite transporter (DMT)-like permease
MIPLIIGILSSAFIFILFRLFPKYGIDTFQAIVFNYFTALTCGFLLYGKDFKAEAIENPSWFPFAILTGFLLIALFLAIGISSQKNGMAITSVSVKMSMAMTMCMMIFAYNELLSLFKILGIILAIIGVLAMSWPSKSGNETKEKTVIWLLIVLFLGSGILDFLLNYVQNYHQKFIPSSLFSAVSFGIAGLFGLSVLIIDLIRKKRTFAFKNIIAGICLGIPNYFSIYLLLLSYSTTGWNDSTVLAICNVSVVLLAAIIGFLGFKENFNKLKIIGLTASIGAIVLLYLASLK